MRWRWLGVALLLMSLIIGFIIAADVKTFEKVEAFAELEDGTPLRDRDVNVPPWNSTQGWVGFTAILSHKGKAWYEAYGLLLPDYELDPDYEPKIVMKVVNDSNPPRISGIRILEFDQFSEAAWNTVKVYAEAYLDKNHLYDTFKFLEVDESDKYVFLFRGLKNDTQSRPILINVKEAWYEEKTLLEPTPPNLFIVGAIAVAGLYLVTIKPKSLRKRRMKKAK